jgi:hypothetical protein
MDLILSFMPIKLVQSLNRSKVEKILISVLMSLGLIATAFTIAKIPIRAKLSKGDPLQATILPSIYAKLEEILGIIACSAPCLKSPVEQMLKKAGILKEHRLARPSFVNTITITTIEHKSDLNQKNGSKFGANGNDAIRIDSVATKPGSSGSAVSGLNARRDGWDAV